VHVCVCLYTDLPVTADVSNIKRLIRGFDITKRGETPASHFPLLLHNTLEALPSRPRCFLVFHGCFYASVVFMKECFGVSSESYHMHTSILCHTAFLLRIEIQAPYMLKHASYESCHYHGYNYVCLSMRTHILYMKDGTLVFRSVIKKIISLYMSIFLGATILMDKCISVGACNARTVCPHVKIFHAIDELTRTGVLIY
jgi:hypothetical protein